jgi:hypothetical protein
MPEIKGNPHPTRSNENPQPAEDREPVQKIIEGKVVRRKAPWYQRLVRGLIAEDVTDMGDLFIAGIIQPAIRNLIWDLGTNVLNSTLYGPSGRGQRRVGSAGSMVGGPVTSLRQRFEQMPTEPRSMSRQDRARHNFDNIQFEDREEAIIVLDALIQRIVKYRVASVADLYDYAGVTAGSYLDQKWGWDDLTTADVRQHRGGWLLDLPQPEPIR